MIFLDEQTGSYLISLLRREIKRNEKNFVAERLLKMAEADEDRKEKIAFCEHNFQPMYGFHERCNGCGGIKNGYETWVSEELKKTLT